MFLALTLAAAICLLGGLVAASSASAFLGESSVIESGGGDLTGPAKTIIENPTFLPEELGEAAASGGAGEAGTAASVFEASGVLPALGGSVLAFGAGFGIGTEICHVIGISGCWDFTAGSESPTDLQEHYKWHFSETAPAKGASPYVWWFGWAGNCGTVCSYTGFGGATCGGEGPTALGSFLATSNGPACGAKEGVESHQGTFIRSAMENRTLSYSASDNPSVPDYEPSGKPYEAPSTWTKNLAERIEGRSGDSAAKVGEKIASKISGSKVSDPYASVKVPDCSGLKVGPCEALVEELDLTPKVTELDWEDAVIEELDTLDPEKTREEESERVITILPSPGEFVVPGTDIEIETNPAKEDMPEFLPKPDKGGGEDGEGENEDEYKKRLVPIFIPGVDELSDATLDPEVGPGRVSHTVPGPAHRFNPATEHDVEVAVNPVTAPLVGGGGGGGGGGGCEASVGAIDWTPLNQPLGSRFPFGVFAFFVAWIGEWSASETAPEWKVTVLPPMLGGKGLQITIDLASMAVVAEVVRVAFIFVSFVGLLWFLGTAAMKIQGDNS